MSRVRAAGLLGAAVCFVVQAAPSLGTTVDDAWISARYADQLVHGHGLVYSQGLPPIEGYTNLGWTLLLAVGIALRVDLFTWMEAWGLLAGLALLPLSLAAARALSTREHLGQLLAPWLLAASPQLAVATTNGLETSLWLAALVAAPLLAVDAVTPRRRVAAGLALGLLGALRPEGYAVGGLVVAALLLRDRQAAVPLAVAASVPVAAQLGFRLATYGAWVPNTLAAKAGSHGTLNLRYLGYDGVLWPMLAALALVAVALVPRRGRALGVALIGALLVGIALRVNLWMPGARLMLPGGVAAAVLIGAAAGRPGGHALGMVAAAGAVVQLLSGVPSFARRYDRVHSVAPHNAASRAAQHLRAHLPPGSVVAVRDAGVFAFHLGPELVVVETHQRALTLPHPHGDPVDLAAYVPQRPDAYVLTFVLPDATALKYTNDKWVRRHAKGAFTRLGRVRQHHRRHYEVRVATRHGVPPLPEHLLAGPR